MSLFERIKSEIPSGTYLKTPVQKVEFRIEYEGDKVVLFKDANRKPFSKIPKICWDGIQDFLKKQGQKTEGWVKIGDVYGTPEEATLQHYLDDFHSQGKTRSTEAGKVASILIRLQVAEVDPKPPSRVRLLYKTK
jgi:hypothetical protein